jgi:23S rRNA (adenine2503-C2)-methyltransferase
MEEGVSERLQAMGEPAYRARQLLHWVFRRRILDPARMTNLPPALRDRLAAEFPPGRLCQEARQVSGDGTVKYLWSRLEGGAVESVRIPTQNRITLCISSQVGCPLGCTFCATGHMGFEADLSRGEMAEQVLRMLEGEPETRSVNVVFMGMGEPFLNTEAVLDAVRLMNDRAEIGARRITISTVGVVPGIEALSRFELQVRLAVSLHAPTDALRSEMMPINRRWPLASLMEACRAYHRSTGRRISFEYAVLPGVNDTPEMVRAMRDLLGDLPAKVNLIPYNPVEGAGFRAPGRGKVERFAEALQAVLVQGVSVRLTRGGDIAAACGQLRTTRERGH